MKINNFGKLVKYSIPYLRVKSIKVSSSGLYHADPNTDVYSAWVVTNRYYADSEYVVRFYTYKGIARVRLESDGPVGLTLYDEDIGMDCFEEKFAECKPATVTLKLMDNLIYYYEIIDSKDGLCEVKSKFTANPNPDWVEKEMTCKYDSTNDFETAVQDMSKCQGPLYTLMTDS